METVFLVINAATIVSLLLSVIYTAGVVWRVEMRLDTSYKFFLAGIILLLAGESIDLLFAVRGSAALSLVADVLRMLFAVSFLAGVLSMRRIVRELDGEKKE